AGSPPGPGSRFLRCAAVLGPVVSATRSSAAPRPAPLPRPHSRLTHTHAQARTRPLAPAAGCLPDAHLARPRRRTDVRAEGTRHEGHHCAEQRIRPGVVLPRCATAE